MLPWPLPCSSSLHFSELVLRLLSQTRSIFRKPLPSLSHSNLEERRGHLEGGPGKGGGSKAERL